MKIRLSGGAFLAAVLVACCIWLVFYAHGAFAREANKLMGRQVERGFFSGVVLVSRDGKVLFEHAYGMANAEEKLPNTLETRFRIGSITKTFTAIMVMQLEGERRLALTDSVCMYIDECPPGWADIKLHHLLSHTSGIYNYTRTKPGEQPVEQMLARHPAQGEDFSRFLHEPLAFAPGEKFEYALQGRVWTLFVRDGHLYARAKDASNPGPDLPLLAESETVFFIKGADGDITIAQDGKGEATGLALNLGDGSRFAKKLR